MRGRNVLLAGGSGGLGLAVTRTFLARGAQVTVPVPHPAEGERLRQALGATLQTPEVDLRDEDSVERMVQGIAPPEVLVHLVGGFAMGPTHEFSATVFRGQLELNVMTTFLVIKHVLGGMLRQRYGRIVTVASRAALEPGPQLAAYSAAKAAVLALTQSIAAETSGTGVTANCVLPSIIDTPANRKAMGDAEASRWVKPERLAETIAFLASEAAGDVRGAAVRVYGDA